MRRFLGRLAVLGAAVLAVQGLVFIGIRAATGPLERARSGAESLRPPPAPPDAKVAEDDGCCGGSAVELLARYTAAIRVPSKRLNVQPVALPGRPPHPAVADELLLRLEEPTGAAAIAGRHGLDLARTVERLGIAVLRSRGGAFAAAELEPMIAALRAEPGVLSAEPHWVALAFFTPNDDFFRHQRGSRAANLEAAWNLTAGDPSVRVAVLDTGVDLQHGDLAMNLVPGANLVDPAQPPEDDNGHGTAVAGIIGARGDNRHGAAGAAYLAKVMPIKVADANGFAAFADLAAGIDHAVQQGVPVHNISMGAYVDSPALRAAVDHALAAGALVVAAAGNDNVSFPAYPAAYPGVLAVGSSSSANRAEVGFGTVLAPSVGVLAPGEDVVAPLPGGVFAFVNGTSAAAAYASGVAALAKSLQRSLTGPQLAQVLRHGADPVLALAPLSELFACGRLDARGSLDRTAPGYQDVAVVRLDLLPEQPLPAGTALVRATVENQGNAPVSNATLVVRYRTPTGTVEIAALAVQNLALGERRAVDVVWSPVPAAGPYDLEAEVRRLAQETEVSDNIRFRSIRVDAAATIDLAIAAMELTPNLAGGQVGLTVLVRNYGNRDEPGVDLIVRANGQVIALPSLAVLRAGSEERFPVSWSVPQAFVPEVITFEATAVARPGEVDLADNVAESKVRIGQSSGRPVGPLWQQSFGVDIIADAPWRIAPGRPYVPLLVFAPHKGDSDPDSRLRFASSQVDVRDVPQRSAPATSIYLDTNGGPPALVPPGLEITDEMGGVVTAGAGGPPDLNLFQDQALNQNGRHVILRVPRDALSVPATVGAALTKYLDVRLDWEYERKLFYGIFTVTRTGSTRKGLAVTFGAAPLPAPPGETHYYDAHLHTVAEWFFDNPINLFAPRKAYGGPICMIAESGYALGMLDSPDPALLGDAFLTTDHSTFYNMSIPAADDADHRPPVGPTSPAANPGPGGTTLSEFTAYGRIFGRARGEEVAIRQDQIVSMFGLAAGLPLGAHMLFYFADHVEGPWHGGGWIPDPGSPNVDVVLSDLLKAAAQAPPVSPPFAPAAFAAHPFSGFLGWSDDHFDLALGLDPALRTRDAVTPTGFVFKGFQLWNGRDTRSMDSSNIDFEDLNPHDDARFQAGRGADWDGQLQQTAVFWHRAIANLLRYSFVGEPETVFPRKVLICAGSDAHGDFNYSISRLATMLSLQETFGVNNGAMADARTLVLADGFPGATAGERALAAYASGRSVVTDGPVITFTMDGDGRFDSANLKWHDGSSTAEDDDGTMGGGGAFDGVGTMLVRRGSEDVHFRYRYDGSPDFGSSGGAVTWIKVYKNEAGTPNPTRLRASGLEEPAPVGSLAAAGANTPLSEPVSLGEEGTVTAPSAYSLAAFTGATDPDVQPPGIGEYRCYTNAVYAMPVDVAITQSQPAGTQAIGTGELEVVFEFPMSMDGGSVGVEVKPLDASGESTDGGVAGAALTGTWSASPATGIRNSVLRLTNASAIALGGDEYPPGSGKVSFVVYFRIRPRDLHGNDLNAIAAPFNADRVPGGSGGSTSPPIAGGGGGSSRGSGGRGRGGGGGGGACGFAAAQDHDAVVGTLWFVAVFVGLAAWRLQRRAPQR